MAVGIVLAYERFETGEGPTTAEWILDWMVVVLLQPVTTLFDAIRHQTGGGIPDFIEWPLLFLNSVLWGFGIAAIWHLIISSHTPSNPDAQKRRAG